MKTLFALFAVAALAAVGCEDKKSSSKSGGTNTTLVQTNTVRERGTASATTTVLVHTATERETKTAGATVTVPATKDKGKNGPDLKEPPK